MGRLAAKRGDVGHTEELMAKHPFYALLGDCYTIVVIPRRQSSVRLFRRVHNRCTGSKGQLFSTNKRRAETRNNVYIVVHVKNQAVLIFSP